MPHESTPTPTPTPPDDGGGDTIIDINLDELIGEVTDLPGEIGEALVDAVKGVFDGAADALFDAITLLITWFPQIHPNPRIEEIHEFTFIVALAIAGVLLSATGLLYMGGWLSSKHQAEIKLTVPRIIVALAFASVSLPLLQYGVDFSVVLTEAFKPDPGFWSMLRFVAELLLISVVQALILLAVALMFVVQKAFIVVGAAASPLIALAWAFPYTREYAKNIISTWWVMLALSPIEMLLIRVNLVLLETPNGDVPHWVLSLGVVTLMAIVPYMLWNASQALVGGYMMGRATTRMNPDRAYQRYKRYRQRDNPDNRGRSRQTTGGRRSGAFTGGQPGQNPYNEYVEPERRDQHRGGDRVW